MQVIAMSDFMIFGHFRTILLSSQTVVSFEVSSWLQVGSNLGLTILVFHEVNLQVVVAEEAGLEGIPRRSTFAKLSHSSLNNTVCPSEL